MRARDFINESTVGSIPTEHEHASKGTYRFRDSGGIDRLYNLNQVMKAAAMSDGHSTKAVDMDNESFAGKNNMAYPYTEVEHTMMKQAFNTVDDTEASDLIRDHRSMEMDDVHKVSPLSQPKHPFDRKKKKS